MTEDFDGDGWGEDDDCDDDDRGMYGRGRGEGEGEEDEFERYQALGDDGAAVGHFRVDEGEGRLEEEGSGNSNGGHNRGMDAAALAVAKNVAAEVKRLDPNLAAKPRSTKDDPEFLSSFYKASRLHWIGTWKARFQAIIETLPPPPPSPPVGSDRLIVHVDMDCFFCSVACLGRPELSGVPVAVTWGDATAKNSNGEISSANYLAREKGVKAGMWLQGAQALCPDLITLPYEFAKYAEAAEKMYRVLFAYTPHVEGVSCDEAYADVTGLGEPDKIMSELRALIREATGCNASIGCSSNRLLARMATAKAKPDGQFLLHSRDAQSFLGGKSVRTLPGVGWSTVQKLSKCGIENVEQMRAKGKPELQRLLGGKTGSLLFDFARGVDNRPWVPRPARKSIGAQATWGVRFEEEEEVMVFIGKLSEQVAERMRDAGVKGRTVQISMMRSVKNADQGSRKGHLGHGICDSMTRSVTLPSFVDDAGEIAAAAKEMAELLRVPPDQVRGMGIQVTRLNTDASSSGAATSNRKIPAQAPPRSTYDPGHVPFWMKQFTDASTTAAAVAKDASLDKGLQMFGGGKSPRGGKSPQGGGKPPTPPAKNGVGSSSTKSIEMTITAEKSPIKGSSPAKRLFGESASNKGGDEALSSMPPPSTGRPLSRQCGSGNQSRAVTFETFQGSPAKRAKVGDKVGGAGGGGVSYAHSLYCDLERLLAGGYEEEAIGLVTGGIEAMGKAGDEAGLKEVMGRLLGLVVRLEVGARGSERFGDAVGRALASASTSMGSYSK